MKIFARAVMTVALVAGIGSASGADKGLDPSAGRERSMKVLMIGNSFSICVLNQMPSICRNLGLKLDLCSLYIGGCPLRKHAKNLSETNRPYLVTWSYASADVPVRKALVPPNKFGNIRDVLAADKWDVVTVQQASHESWDAANYEPFGTQVLAAIRELAPQAKVYVQQTWSYASVAERLVAWKFDQLGMFKRIEAAYGDFAARHGMDLIRTGEAIQRYRRARSVCAAPDAYDARDVVGAGIAVTTTKNGVKVSGDTIHLNPRGNYLQGLVWTAKLFGADVTKSTYVPGFLAKDPADAALMRKIANEVR